VTQTPPGHGGGDRDKPPKPAHDPRDTARLVWGEHTHEEGTMITKHQTRKARHESERLFRNEQTRRGVSEEQIAADIREMRAEARKATKQTTSTTTHTPKEGAMTKTASKKNSVTSPETKTKKSPKPHKIANVMPKTRKTHDHEEIVLAVRATEPTDSAMRAMAEAKFGVVIVAGEFGKAPNPGLIKMRAANVIRGALVRAGRFTGDVYRIPRAKKSKSTKKAA